MAELITEDSVVLRTRRGSGNGYKYPWETWRDGQWRLALAGEDYTCSEDSFRTSVYDNATRHGTRARTHAVEGGVAFVILEKYADEFPPYPGE